MNDLPSRDANLLEPWMARDAVAMLGLLSYSSVILAERSQKDQRFQGSKKFRGAHPAYLAIVAVLMPVVPIRTGQFQARQHSNQVDN
jgi:hypothetical protein